MRHEIGGSRKGSIERWTYNVGRIVDIPSGGWLPGAITGDDNLGGL